MTFLIIDLEDGRLESTELQNVAEGAAGMDTKYVIKHDYAITLLPNEFSDPPYQPVIHELTSEQEQNYAMALRDNKLHKEGLSDEAITEHKSGENAATSAFGKRDAFPTTKMIQEAVDKGVETGAVHVDPADSVSSEENKK